MASTNQSIVEYLAQKSSENTAYQADRRQLKYVSETRRATWSGTKNANHYARVEGKEVQLSGIIATRAVPEGSQILVRYSNGKFVGTW